MRSGLRREHCYLIYFTLCQFNVIEIDVLRLGKVFNAAVYDSIERHCHVYQIRYV